jgi:hypothetical protein
MRLTQDDIDNGYPSTWDGWPNPVSLAVERGTGALCNANLKYGITVYGSYYRTYDMPSVLIRFLNRFDKGESVYPLEFELGIAKHIHWRTNNV